MHVLTNAEKLIPRRDAASLAESRKLAGIRIVTGTTSPFTRYERISVSPASCSIRSEYVIAFYTFKLQYKCNNSTPAWEQRKFSEIVDVCSGRDYKHLDGGPIPVYGTGGYMTSVSEALSHNRDAIGIGRKGTIDKPYLLKAPFWTVDTLFYAIPKSDINLEFALCSFSNVDWKSKDESTGLPSLSKESINETVLSVPNVVEQNHLGSFFADLDRLITLHQRKYDKLVILKKSMLEKMFPKDGESVPEIRFAGFTDPWEQRKLGELFEESDERASDREILSVSVANGIYPASESDRETNPGASLANYKIVHFGDVVYNSMRMWQGAVDASRYDGIVSPAYVVARPNSEVYARFFARLLRQPMLLKQYQQVSQGNSKDTQVLKFDDFASIGISMPASENEQRRIGGFFDRLDSLITLHQRKLELLQNIKKSLLDKMFV